MRRLLAPVALLCLLMFVTSAGLFVAGFFGFESTFFDRKINSTDYTLRSRQHGMTVTRQRWNSTLPGHPNTRFNLDVPGLWVDVDDAYAQSVGISLGVQQVEVSYSLLMVVSSIAPVFWFVRWRRRHRGSKGFPVMVGPDVSNGPAQ